MDLNLLLVAYGFGLAATVVRLPPMVGYLTAGFVLHALGETSSPAIERFADIGILLLLFGIGLRLDLRTLARPVVAGTAVVFAGIATIFPAVVLLLAAKVDNPLGDDLGVGPALLVAFALSFSSTVFAVKTMERTNDGRSLSGRIAIGVLVIQDVLAVMFIVMLDASWPSPWFAAVVAGTLLVRPLLGVLLDLSGRGELFVLFGFALTVMMSTELFEAVDVKPDLGALFAGIVLSGHPRSSELADRLLSFKDLFLVGFFLSIGLAGTPSANAWFIGLLLVLLVPTRSGALFLVLTRFRLRARTALHTSLTLSTFSEFGLIVVAAAVADDLLDSEWLAVMAVAVSGSFIVASTTSALRYEIYDRWHGWAVRMERRPHLPDDAVIDTGPVKVLVFGMGQVGTGAYDELIAQERGPVAGVERDDEVVRMHAAEGRRVILGDALDRDFWERVSVHPQIELVIAATNNHQANLQCVERIREWLPDAKIASIATYPDEVEELRKAGVDVASNLFEEAGQALAFDAVGEVWAERPDPTDGFESAEPIETAPSTDGSEPEPPSEPDAPTNRIDLAAPTNPKKPKNPTAAGEPTPG